MHKQVAMHKQEQIRRLKRKILELETKGKKEEKILPYRLQLRRVEEGRR